MLAHTAVLPVLHDFRSQPAAARWEDFVGSFSHGWHRGLLYFHTSGVLAPARVLTRVVTLLRMLAHTRFRWFYPTLFPCGSKGFGFAIAYGLLSTLFSPSIYAPCSRVATPPQDSGTAAFTCPGEPWISGISGKNYRFSPRLTRVVAMLRMFTRMACWVYPSVSGSASSALTGGKDGWFSP